MYIEHFTELFVYGRSVRNMLQPWESAIDFDDRVYPNLVHVFYLNMEISATRLDRIVTHVGGAPIEFDVKDLNNILELRMPVIRFIHSFVCQFCSSCWCSKHFSASRSY